MKKALIMLCVLVCVVSFSACSHEYIFHSGSAGENNRMSVVYNSGNTIIYRDNETGVQYISRFNCGTCVVVDRDGKPYIGDEKND